MVGPSAHLRVVGRLLTGLLEDASGLLNAATGIEDLPFEDLGVENVAVAISRSFSHGR